MKSVNINYKSVLRKVVTSLLVLPILLQSIAPAVVSAEDASGSAAQSDSQTASQSASLTPTPTPAPTQAVTTIPSATDIPNPFNENNAITPDNGQQTFSQTVRSLLNSSLGPSLPPDSASIRQPSVMQKLLRHTFKSGESIDLTVSNAKAEDLHVTLTDWKGRVVNTVLIDKTTIDSQTAISVHPPKFGFRPGRYKLTITDAQGKTTTQDFTWGVLALNTNKSLYTPQETAKIAMAVLDDSGNMVCDAKVTLQISSANPSSPSATLSTDNGKITVNPQCLSHSFSLTPDYETSYQLPQIGQYNLTLTAVTKNGTSTINDSIKVVDTVAFDVQRTTATRIYPPNEYPVIFHIKANQDFTGVVTDFAPTNFAISPYATGSAQTYSSTAIALPTVDRLTAFGVPAVSLGKPFNGNFPMGQGFGEAVTDPQEAPFYASFGLAGHDGLDFSTPMGTPILATDDGTVILAGDGAYGTTVVIDHTWGRSYYGHLSTLFVKAGDKVTKGYKIALSGNSGHTTGPHLHFGIKPIHPDMQNGYYGKVDPSPYFSDNTSGTEGGTLGVGTANFGDTSMKVIRWNVSLKKGDEIDLAYMFKTPKASPAFYTLGPLTFSQGKQTVFQETRQWQLAIDYTGFPSTSYLSNTTSAVDTGVTAWQVVTSAPASGNTVTSAKQSNSTGYIQWQPNTANVTYGSGIPTGPNGKGWIVDTSVDGTIPTGNWTFNVTTTTSNASGTGHVVVCAWVVHMESQVPVKDSTIFPSGADCNEGLQNIMASGTGAVNSPVSILSVPAVTFSKNEFLYVEYWLRMTIAGGNNPATTTFTVNGGVNQDIVTPGTSTNAAPAAPTQVSPASGATNISTFPTFTMTDSDPEADTLSYKVTIYSDSACTNVVQTNDQASTLTGWSTVQNDSNSNIATAVATTSATISWIQTVGTQSNRILIVSLAGGNTGATFPTVLDNGTPMTKITRIGRSGGDSEMWYILNPPSGANTIYANQVPSNIASAGSSEFYNVDSVSPIDTYALAQGSGTSETNSITTTSKMLVHDFINPNSAVAETPTAPQSLLWSANFVAGSSNTAGASSTSMGWSQSSVTWSWIAAAINPVATFVAQSPLNNATYWWKASATDTNGSGTTTDSACSAFTPGPVPGSRMHHGKWFLNGAIQPFAF